MTKRCHYSVFCLLSLNAGRLTMSLVMEYLPYGSLIGYLEKNQHKVNTQRLLLFASQICKVRVGDVSRGGKKNHFFVQLSIYEYASSNQCLLCLLNKTIRSLIFETCQCCFF